MSDRTIGFHLQRAMAHPGRSAHSRNRLPFAPCRRMAPGVKNLSRRAIRLPAGGGEARFTAGQPPASVHRSSGGRTRRGVVAIGPTLSRRECPVDGPPSRAVRAGRWRAWKSGAARPARHREMIDHRAAPGHPLLQVARAQRAGRVPVRAHQHGLQREAQSLDHSSPGRVPELDAQRQRRATFLGGLDAPSTSWGIDEIRREGGSSP